MKIFNGLFIQVLFPVLFAVFLAASTIFYQAKDTNKFLIYGLLAWISVGLAAIVFIKPNLNLENELSGTIRPDNKPRPQTQLTSSVPPNAYLLLLGNSVAWCDKLPINILTIKNEPIISLSESKGDLLLSAKFTDENNKIIAKLTNNEWQINPNNYFRKERPNKSQLKIYDQHDSEILNLYFINPTTIKLTGIFRDKALKDPIVFTDEYAILPGNNRFYGFSFGGIRGSAIGIN